MHEFSVRPPLSVDDTNWSLYCIDGDVSYRMSAQTSEAQASIMAWALGKIADGATLTASDGESYMGPTDGVAP